MMQKIKKLLVKYREPITYILVGGGTTAVAWGYADQAIMDQVSFEVKFFLSPDKALAENHLLTEAVADQFSLGQEYTPIDVIYLETADRAFTSEGWVNRIRWKEGKKKPECTCKKRYPVAGDDQASILAAALSVIQPGPSPGLIYESSTPPLLGGVWFFGFYASPVLQGRPMVRRYA